MVIKKFCNNNRNIRTKLYNLVFKVDGALTALLIFCSVVFISFYGIFYDTDLTRFEKEKSFRSSKNRTSCYDNSNM